MELNQIMGYILDAIPHPIVFVDCDHIIRYMNKRAKYHYYEERGYRDLIGRSLFDCHHENSRKTIETIIETSMNVACSLSPAPCALSHMTKAIWVMF
jgi:DUF438 domain-containing protein